MISGSTKVFGLLGRPIEHSLSPRMHNHWFEQHRIDAVYLPFRVPKGEVPDPVGMVRWGGVSGLNLTVPFKSTEALALDAIDEVGQAVGAVNVVRADSGRVVGENTDAIGWVRAVESVGGVLGGARVVVVGAGGAGRAAAAGALLRGARHVVLINRSPLGRAAARLAEAWAGSVEEARWGDEGFRALERADVVVVATSGAGSRALAERSLPRLPSEGLWCDLNYWDADPPHRETAVRAGWQFQSGLRMLIEQGAAAFSLFTSVHPDVAAMEGLLSPPTDEPLC